MNIKQSILTLLGKTKRAGPEIITAVSISGFIFSTILIAIETPKICDILRKKLIEDHDMDVRTDKEVIHLTRQLYQPKDIFLSVWKTYLPSVISLTASTGLMIFAEILKNRRMTALLTAYNMSERALERYSQKVIDEFGDDKDKEIRQKIAHDEENRHAIGLLTSADKKLGDDVCFETLTGRYFYANSTIIKRIENRANMAMREESTFSLNELFIECGLDETKLGNHLGWDIDDGYLNIMLDTQLTTDDKPCIVLCYSRLPKKI